ncbi:MAG TPA: hemerythrin domain-containing protein [Kofleriaceae bacterium]|nr:hemerythrin domain-containing protein [Kofleriaceae bacterium]
MQPFRSKLEQLVRGARARMPARARGIVDRIEGMVQARRAQPPEPPPPPVVVAEPPPAPPAPKAVNWELRSQADIVDHIEQHYHAGLRRDLPELVAEARKAERAGHAGGLADLLEEFANELEAHMMKEERVLFPILRGGNRGGPVDMPIRMMEREHESHDEQLARIRTQTNDFTAPAEAAWASLYARLAVLEAELRQHIYLENNVLFARAVGGEY